MPKELRPWFQILPNLSLHHITNIVPLPSFFFFPYQSIRGEEMTSWLCCNEKKYLWPICRITLFSIITNCFNIGKRGSSKPYITLPAFGRLKEDKI